MRPLTLAGALVVLLATATVPAFGADDATTLEDLKRQVAAQQAQIDALTTKYEPTGAAPSRTHLGGYGELHYNNFDSKTELDFHRFVLYFAHEFADDIRFYSEFELEHALAGEGQNGEVELEQAYIEMDIAGDTRLKAGLFLLPVGILNETHEPTTFYGVERNPVETNIIPSTWWEGGVAVDGAIGSGGWHYDLALHSGLNVGNSFVIRSGRQKVSEAVAEELATSARLRYTGVAGLELSASVTYQGDITQGLVAGAGAGTLLTTHATYENGAFSARALWARWSLDGAAPAAAGKDEQDGAYAEAGWKFTPELGAFARYNLWDNGGVGMTERSQANVGINWWPHPNVVFKFDLQDQGKSVDDDGFSLGVGYRF